MRRLAVFALALALGGCQAFSNLASTGDILSPAGSVSSTPAPALADVRYFAIVTTNVGENGAVDVGNITAIASSRYDLVVLGEVTTSSTTSKLSEPSIIAQLHATSGLSGAHKVVLAYLDIGEAENFRTYWEPTWTTGNPSFILGPDPNGYANLFAVNYTDQRWQSIVFGSAGALVDQALADGFDGAFLDNVDAYSFPNVQNVDHTAQADMMTFVAAISAYAKSRNPRFLIVVDGGAGLTSDSRLMPAIDADAEEGLFFSASPTQLGDITQDLGSRATTLTLLQSIQTAQKPVFSIDFALNPLDVQLAYAGGAANRLIEYVTTRDLAALTTSPPPALSPAGRLRRVQ